MELKELDILAQQNEQMPKRLNVYEQTYYIACRGLYQQFKDNKITLEQARKEKDLIIETYRYQESVWEMFKGIHLIEGRLKKLKEQGFNSVIEFEILEDIEKFIRQSTGKKEGKS